ncbi:hypothetical protein [Anaeromyxobacter oryzae]|uniref:Uncharacterized protein n=1 Tax=Anaeromyxobacter oryzae TaxID=2918170 RepID=A0ABM7WQT2_9BACT|nr:hypothetical protein [Anaeromyxobacter oryzae]BDG01826.1 hypothetical protein AMOR_08220 [Anaeromyxobacter oryzae]
MPVRVEGSPSAVPTFSVGPHPPPPIGERPMFEFRPEPRSRSETHRINLANRRLDLADYERYLDRWAAGLKGCRTPEEVAEYGEPAPPPSSMPAGWTAREGEDFEALHQRGLGLLERTMREKGEVELRLAGMPVPLSVELSASAQVSVAAGDRQLAAGASIGRGGVTADAVFGSRNQRITASVGPSTPLTAARQVGLPGATVTTSGGERLDRLELEAFPGAPVSPFVASDGRSVELGVRAGRRLKEGPVEVAVEGRASARWNLLSTETVRWALSSRPRVTVRP